MIWYINPDMPEKKKSAKIKNCMCFLLGTPSLNSKAFASFIFNSPLLLNIVIFFDFSIENASIIFAHHIVNGSRYMKIKGCGHHIFIEIYIVEKFKSNFN